MTSGYFISCNYRDPVAPLRACIAVRHRNQIIWSERSSTWQHLMCSQVHRFINTITYLFTQDLVLSEHC